MSAPAIVFADRLDGAPRWGFRVGPERAPLALMPPFAETPDEAAALAALFADEVRVAGPRPLPAAGTVAA